MSDIMQATTVQERVKAKIQETFVGLISDDEWNKLIKTEVDRFVKPTCNSYGDFKSSPLQQIIEAELKERFKALVKAELDKPEYQGMWQYSNGNGTSYMTAGEAVQKIIQNSVPQLVQGLFNQVVQANVDQIKYLFAPNR